MLNNRVATQSREVQEKLKKLQKSEKIRFLVKSQVESQNLKKKDLVCLRLLRYILFKII